MQDEAKVYLTDKQLCRRWQCSQMKLYRLRQRGLLKSMKVGGTGPHLTPVDHVAELEITKEETNAA